MLCLPHRVSTHVSGGVVVIQAGGGLGAAQPNAGGLGIQGQMVVC